MSIKYCLYCGKEFEVAIHNQKFCCEKCRTKYHNDKKKKDNPKRRCIICNRWYTPRHGKQVTCGREECVKQREKDVKKGRPKTYLYAKYEGLETSLLKPPRKRKKSWKRCTPEERWEQMNLTEISKEILRFFPKKSYAQVRLLKEQGKLPDDFGLECRK